VKRVRYVGIDIGKQRCRAAVMDENGFLVEEFSFRNNSGGIEGLASKLSVDDRVVMESTGSVWMNLYESLEEMRVQVVLANPLKTKAIASARIKSDKIDARILAHLLRGDLVAESYVPPKHLREIRALVRHRMSLLKVRTMVKNRVHALIDKYGYKHGFSDLFGRKGVEWLKLLEFGSLDRLMLSNYLEHIECLNRQIERIDLEILDEASHDEDVKLLLSMTGIGVYTALLIKSEIGDIHRFPNYKKLVSWAGLAPSLHQSGNVKFHGRITKQGSKTFRWAMVECARIAVRFDGRMGSFYERVKHRRGDQKAIVAVACKMLKIIWTMLMRGEPYESRNQRRYDEKLNFITKQ